MTTSLDRFLSFRPDPALLPEVAPFLAFLQARLPAVRGNPQLRVDAENLLAGIEGVTAARAAGRASPEIDAAAAHLARLGADMLVRAEAALAQSDGALLLGAEMAAEGAGAETDLTEAFAARRALPAPVDGSRLQVVPTGFQPGESDFGRLTGNFLTVNVQDDTSCAPPGSTILPLGAKLEFAEGQSFILHHCGARSGSGAEVPQEIGNNIFNMFVQAGAGGVTLRGPAVLSTAPVSIDCDDLKFIESEGLKKDDEPVYIFVTSVFASIAMGAARLAAAFDGEIPEDSPIEIIHLFNLGLIIFIAFAVFSSIPAWKYIRSVKRMKSFNGRLRKTFSRLAGCLVPPARLSARFNLLGHASINKETQVNIVPPRHIASPGRRPEVLSPGRALPAPLPEAVGPSMKARQEVRS